MRSCKKNFCREHCTCPGPVLKQMQFLGQRVNFWIDSLDKAMVDRGEALLWCKRVLPAAPPPGHDGHDPDVAFRNVIVLIAGVRRSPKMQYVIKCEWAMQENWIMFGELPDFPFNVRLAVGPSRIGAELG